MRLFTEFIETQNYPTSLDYSRLKIKLFLCAELLEKLLLDNLLTQIHRWDFNCFRKKSYILANICWSWRRLQHVFSVTILRLPRRLEDVLKTFSRPLTRRLEDVLEDEKLLRWKRLEDVLKTCLEDMSWRPLEDIMEKSKILTADICI